MTAIAYLRVSTTEQAERGFGLDVQQKAVEEYCADHELELSAVHTDAGVSGSGSIDRRPALAAALAAAEANPGGRLVVYRLDRLARDLVLQELLLQRLSTSGTAVISATEPDIDTLGSDPTKVLIRQILGALGQYERALIRGRMAAGRAAKAAAGGYVGGAPRYGHRAAGGSLTTHDREAMALALIARLSSQGRSLRSICSALDDAGFKPRRAAHWQPSVVRGILLRTE
jgi:DNA invertase Pin-like site-specific DNA recombinase